MESANLMVVQGGGPTAVLNTSLAGILDEASGKFGRILGSRYGIRGVIENSVADLSHPTPALLELLRNSPGAALGSSRHQPQSGEMERLVANLRELEISHMLFMGGNGTMRGADLIGEACRAAGLAIAIIGIPKTVDNDLAITDRSPGFASAARYVAQSTRDLGMDIRALPQPVTILETMGRSVGWLSAASLLARERDNDAPHLVYAPELAFSTERFLADLDGIVGRQGWAVVVVSEGLQTASGEPVYQVSDASQTDPLKRPMTGGVAQYLADLVARNLKMRCRSEKPGLLGRCSMLHVSEQDRRDAELVGRAGVRALTADETGKMIALTSLKDSGGPGHILVPLSEVAGRERPIPRQWIADGLSTLSPALREYLKPLMGELPTYITPFETIEPEKESSAHA